MEDAYESLLLEFIESVHRIKLNTIQNRSDGAIVKYIERIVKSCYILLLNKKMKDHGATIGLDDIPGYERIIAISQFEDCLYDYIPEKTFQKILTQREKQILYLIYEKGYTAAEIARTYGISRQCANQAKQSAIRKLRKYYNDTFKA